MPAASKRPANDELRAKAQESGMTFVKLANYYAVDRKTVRRWCRDIGVNKCGVPGNGKGNGNEKTVKNQTHEAQPAPENNTKNENKDNIVSREELLALKNQLSSLMDKVNLLEQGLSGLSMPLKTELEEVKSEADEQVDFDSFRNILTELSIICSTDKDMEYDQALILEHLKIIVWHIMGSEIRKIHNRIENHHHLSLSINNSQEWLEENKRKQQFERGARNAPDNNRTV